jgi:hypothetical protein
MAPTDRTTSHPGLSNSNKLSDEKKEGPQDQKVERRERRRVFLVEYKKHNTRKTLDDALNLILTGRCSVY